ncbi:MAG: hypothetical protein NVS4B8_27510 [Herpetosiphon sp.]
MPINYLSAGVTLLLSLLFGYLGFRVYAYRSFKTKFRDPLSRYVPVWEAFETGFGSDDYVHFFMRPFVATARFLSRIVDPLGIDGLVNGAGRLVGLTGTGLRRGQSGYLRNYTLVFLAGAVAVIGYFGYAATR